MVSPSKKKKSATGKVFHTAHVDRELNTFLSRITPRSSQDGTRLDEWRMNCDSQAVGILIDILSFQTASPFKVPASKLRESSITSALDKSSMRSRSSSIDSHSSASTRTSSILSGRGVAFSNGSPTKNNRNNLPKPPSPPRMPPPARIPEPDFMIGECCCRSYLKLALRNAFEDVEGDETGSSTDTDDSS